MLPTWTRSRQTAMKPKRPALLTTIVRHAPTTVAIVFVLLFLGMLRVVANTSRSSSTSKASPKESATATPWMSNNGKALTLLTARSSNTPTPSLQEDLDAVIEVWSLRRHRELRQRRQAAGSGVKSGPKTGLKTGPTLVSSLTSESSSSSKTGEQTVQRRHVTGQKQRAQRAQPAQRIY